MTSSNHSIAREVDRYLRTGESDAHCGAWSGNFFERARRAREELRSALVLDVTRRAEGGTSGSSPDVDCVAMTRERVEPMIRGLFPRAEQDVVLAAVQESVVIVTSSNIESILREQDFDGSAWTLANLYLESVGAELLDENAPRLVGLSEGTTCYLTPEYFDEADPFADFLVHEVAHLFHNCKRRDAGLRETRTKEWLLEIEFRKRETFAYSCEAYSRVLRQGRSRAERRRLAEEFAKRFRAADKRVDPAEVAAIVTEASAARNGWKVILARCSPVVRTRAASPHASWNAGRESDTAKGLAR